MRRWMGWRKAAVGGVLSVLVLGLMACGDDEPVRFSGLLDDDVTWSGEVLVSGELVVNSMLTIEPCTTVRLARGVSIRTVDYGEIKSVGREDCPITFQRIKPAAYSDSDSDRPDLQQYSSTDNWGGIVLGVGKRGENVFEYTYFKQGGNLSKAMLVAEADSTVSVRHSLFEGSTSHGVLLDDKANVKEFSDVTFNHSGYFTGHALSVGYRTAGVLEGIGSDVPERNRIFVDGGEDALQEDVVWKKQGVPYLTAGMVLEATLELEAGVQLLVEHRGGIVLSTGGSLQSVGTAEDRVVIESGHYDRKAGAWRGIVISPEARADILIEHTEIRHAQIALEGLPYFGPNVVIYSAMRVRDVLIEQTSDFGAKLSLNVNLEEFSNVHFKDIESYPLLVSYNGVSAIDNISGEGLGVAQIWIDGGTAVRDAVWSKQAFPYFITSGRVEARVDVDAGVEFAVNNGQYITVDERGSFNTHGTDADPVVFGMAYGSGYVNDTYFYGIQFNYLDLLEEGAESVLKHTVFKGYVNSGGNGAIEIYPKRKVTLDHVRFEQFSCDVGLLQDADPPTVIETPYRLCVK